MVLCLQLEEAEITSYSVFGTIARLLIKTSIPYPGLGLGALFLHGLFGNKGQRGLFPIFETLTDNVHGLRSFGFVAQSRLSFLSILEPTMFNQPSQWLVIQLIRPRVLADLHHTAQ